ncbi:carboxylate-amine ligase [Chryseolinea lacunae]|uniref:Glutamate--cysteine ligase n=1 Tax=Chryseolinea lacunae TaxID=2801331 RepID=A0ABS1KLG1_9BACT|nr:glutamate-cysteine ligase family protein [Chryseolinea lacunae]MBL0740295.1 glutamate--cysteine ligase [Chryseolinea lacunae]
MTQPSRIHLFQGYGVELEYMLVDRTTLQVKPITDDLLKHVLGHYGSDVDKGMVTWSNELVMHVVELKSTKPESDFVALDKEFAKNVTDINTILASWNAMLLPSAAHPFMNPMTETKLWPHENNEVYTIYNKIFDCRGHGWSNLQSTHLNLPFYDDEEFARLHAAIRLVLPLLPALCASSPILDGRLTGLLDTRLKYYKTNQSRIPCITGKVIPEAVFSRRNYFNTIYEKIKTDITPFDPEGELNPIWVNSRGAIPRFDRGSIEIRIMDIQECPSADLAVVSFVIELIKALVAGKFIDHEAQMKWKTEVLAQLLDQTVEKGQQAIIANAEYLALLGMPAKAATAQEILKHLVERMIAQGKLGEWKKPLDVILEDGPLAQRMVKATGAEPTHERVVEVYKQLAQCLAANEMFRP